MNWTETFASRSRQRLLLLILIAVPFLNGLTGAFVFDDDKQIVNNSQIESFSPISKFLTTKRPLVELSLALNYAISGLETWSYHLFNLALHLGTSLLLHAWLLLLLPQIGGLRLGRFKIQSLAFAITLLWAVHPVQTETVTYVIQRAEGLASCFYLAALFCWLRSLHAGRSRLLYLFLTGLSAWLGMMSKSIVITLPLALLLQDYFVLTTKRRPFSKVTIVAWLWILSAGLHPVLTGLLKGVTRGVHGGNAAVGFTVKGLSAWDYLLSQTSALVDYLLLIIAPFSLCLDHGREAPANLGEVFLPGLLVLGLLGLVAWGLWQRRPFAAGLGFFFLVLAPTSSFIPIRDIFVEHRIYLAMLGPLAGLVVLALRFMKSAATGLLVLSLLYLVLAGLTLARNRDYQDDLGMWRDIVAKCPENPRGHYTLGVFDARDQQYESAIRRAERALALDPDYELAWVLVASSQLGLNQPVAAEAAARAALAIDDDLQIAYTNLGDALLQQNRIDEAIAAHRAAIKAKKKFPSPHVDLAEVLLRDQQEEEAWTSLETAFERGADRDPRAWQLRAVILRRRGDFAAAVEAYRRALEMRPDSHDLQLNLAIAWQAMGHYEDAKIAVEGAIRSDERSFRAHLALASLAAELGDFEAAVRAYDVAADRFRALGPGRDFPAAEAQARAKQTLAAQLKLESLSDEGWATASPLELSHYAEVLLATGKKEAGLARLQEAFRADPKLAEDLDRALRFRGALAAVDLAQELPDSDYLSLALDWLAADLLWRSAQIRRAGPDAVAARSALLTWKGHRQLQPLWQFDSKLKEKERRQQLLAEIDALLDWK